jgi:hypothetical protein
MVLGTNLNREEYERLALEGKWSDSEAVPLDDTIYHYYFPHVFRGGEERREMILFHPE